MCSVSDRQDLTLHNTRALPGCAGGCVICDGGASLPSKMLAEPVSLVKYTGSYSVPNGSSPLHPVTNYAFVTDHR